MDFPRFCPIDTQDLFLPFFNTHSSNYFRPWQCYAQSAVKDFGSTIYNERERFKITLDVQHFQPEDISVKVTDKEIIFEGKHEERQDDHGYVTRYLRRRYILPSDCLPDNVSSTLSSDGILVVVAEKTLNKVMEKVVPIKFSETKKEIIEIRTSTGITQKDIDDTIKEAKDLINKNKGQIIIKEDHSRLLKPEFMSETTTNVSQYVQETKQESEDLLKTSEKLGEINTNVDINNACKISGMGMGELAEQVNKTNITSSSGFKSVAQETATQEACSFKSSMSSSSSSMKSSSKQTSQILSSDISAELKEAAEST